MQFIKALCLICFLIFGEISGFTMSVVPISVEQNVSLQFAKKSSFSDRQLLKIQQKKERNKSTDNKAEHRRKIVYYCLFLLLGIGLVSLISVLGFATIGKILLSFASCLLGLLLIIVSIVGINGHLKLLKQDK